MQHRQFALSADEARAAPGVLRIDFGTISCFGLGGERRSAGIAEPRPRPVHTSAATALDRHGPQSVAGSSGLTSMITSAGRLASFAA